MMMYNGESLELKYSSSRPQLNQYIYIMSSASLVFCQGAVPGQFHCQLLNDTHSRSCSGVLISGSKMLILIF